MLCYRPPGFLLRTSNLALMRLLMLRDRRPAYHSWKMFSASLHTEPEPSYIDAPNYGVYRNVGLAAQRLTDIVTAVSFENWPHLDSLAEEAGSQFTAISPDQYDILTECLRPSDDFELQVPKVLELLSKIAVRNDPKFSNLRILAGEPARTYGPNGGSHRVLHDVAVYTSTYAENIPPDTGVRPTSPWSEGEDLRPSDDLSESLASAYNRYFSSCHQRNEEGDISDDRLLNQISETILTALHTRSGWYCLYRESEAIFLHVECSQVSKARWLNVRLSDICKHDGTVSILHGLLALFQACRVADDSKLRQLSDTATRLMMCTAKRYDKITQAVRSNNRSEPYPTDKLEDRLGLARVGRTELQNALQGETLLVLNQGELARLFLVNCRGYIGCGSSGYVVRSCVEGVDFAVKRWNRYEWGLHNAGDGLDGLLYDIQAYAYLHKYNRDVLRRIVPKPIAICIDDSNEFIEKALVTTAVEERVDIQKVVSGEEGSQREAWSVNGKELDEEYIREVKQGIKENLEELERLGIRTYDGCERNIRVDRVKNETWKGKWRVWTIDLGECLVCHDGREMGLDSLKSVAGTSPQYTGYSQNFHVINKFTYPDEQTEFCLPRD